MNSTLTVLVVLLLMEIECFELTEVNGQLEHHLREVYDASELNKEKEVIIILGNSGTGKSTLSKFLRRDPTLRTEMNADHQWVFTDDDHQIGSQPFARNSSIPKPNVDEETGAYVVEFAGFQETRSPPFDLLTAFFNKRILRTGGKMKILIVEDVSNLQKGDKIDSFKSVLAQIANLIGSNISSFVESLGLVATKVDIKDTEENILLQIKAFLGEVLQHAEDKQKEAMKGHDEEEAEKLRKQVRLLNILRSGAKVGLMRRPQTGELKLLEGNRQQLRELVFKTLNSSKPLAREFEPSVAVETVNYIKENMLEDGKSNFNIQIQLLQNDLLEKFQETTSVMIRPMQRKTKIVIDAFAKYLKVINFGINTLDHFENFSRRRGVDEGNLLQLRFRADVSIFLHQMEDEDIKTFQAKAIFDLKSSLVRYLIADIKFYLFLEKMIEDFGTFQFQSGGTQVFEEILKVDFQNIGTLLANLRKWQFSEETVLSASSLNLTEANVKELKLLGLDFQHGEVEVKTADTTVIFHGRFIILSKLKNQMENTTAGEIVLVAGEKLFVDCDMSLRHTHLKLVAPVIEIVAETTFHLLGENGAKVDKAANCVREEVEAPNGIKGNDGFSSGNFTLLALDLRFAHLLKVVLEGGNGGPGQNGGDGCDGEGYDLPAEVIVRDNGSTNIDFCETPEVKALQVDTCTSLSSSEYHLLKNALPPSNGGNCAEGGNGALPGAHMLLVRNREAAELVQLKTHSGTAGAVGQGGAAGKMVSLCSESFYKCTDGICSRHHPVNNEGAKCNSTIKASIGRQMSFRDSSNMHQKFGESGLLEQAFQYYKVVSGQALDLEADSSAGQFLKFLFTLSYEVIPQFTTQGYLDMMNAAETKLGNGKESDLRYIIQRRRFFYSAKLQCMRRWRQVRSDGDLEIIAEMIMISLLDTWNAFLHGDHIEKVYESVDEQLNRLSDVEKAIQQASNSEDLAAEKQKLLSKIADAKNQMDKISGWYPDEMKKQAVEDFGRILEITKEMKDNYEKGVESLVSQTQRFLTGMNNTNNQMDKIRGWSTEEIKKQAVEEFDPIWEITKQMEEDYEENLELLVSEKMMQNLGLDALDSITLIFSFISDSLVMLGSTLVGVSSAETPSSVNEPTVERTVQNIRKILQTLEEQKAAQQKYLVESANEIIQADAKVPFLNEEIRKSLKILLSHASEGKLVNSISIAPLLIAMRMEFNDAKGDGVKMAGNNSNQSWMHNIERLAGTAVGAAKILHEYRNDSFKANQVEEAIRRNKEDLQGLVTFEDRLQQTLKPNLERMLQAYESLGSKLDTQTAYELLFDEIDLKSITRECVSLVHTLTRDLFGEKDDLAPFLTVLQESLTIMMDVLNEIEELRYRIYLAEFLDLSAVKCPPASDTELCIFSKNLAQILRTNQLVREFAHVFAAYQQASFPFGVEKMSLLSSDHLSLLFLPKETVVELLRSTLQTIRDDLSSARNSTGHHKDVVFTEFSSRFKTTSPFFVWPNAHYSSQIDDLLSGKRVTLMASASTPGVKNAVKANWVQLNITSKDEKTTKQLENLLQHFHIEMVRSGESYFRCGGAVYALGGADLNQTSTFEREDRGHFVKREKLSDVPLSPYVLWKFKLVHASQEDSTVLLKQLELLSDKVDLELVGEGSYVKEGAAICSSDLGRAYNYVGI